MSVHRMPPRDEPFDPRLAALAHAAAAGRAVGSAGPMDGFGQNPIMLDAGVLAELANAVACGLVYVGDQVREARGGEVSLSGRRAQVVGWDSDDGGGVLVRVSSGSTYRIQVGMPFEIPTTMDPWREFLREQAAQIPDGVRAAAEKLVARFEQSAIGWTLDEQPVTGDVADAVLSLADWLSQLSDVRREVADGRAGE